MKVILATHNPGKIREFSQMAAPHGIELLPMPDDLDPEETGSTFMENALIKARAAAKVTNLPAVADDSGLEVDALGGRPGIRSARYCEGSDADRRVKILEEMVSIPAGKRQAAFVCAMALCLPDGSILKTTEERWHGSIGFDSRGENGFGYDPIFYFPEYGLTMAQLRPQKKHSVSHRGRAVEAIAPLLRDVLDGQ